jgi:8-oxo-dGTP pyrophosphatase MutT (NUDIX family)
VYVDSKKVVQKVVLGGVVIGKDAKFLIMQRHDNEDIYPGLWELPSGKKEELEEAESSLIREIKEEAGVDVEILLPVSVFNYQIEKPDELRDSTQINFLVKIKEGQEVKISDEHQAYAWVGKGELDNYGMSEATKGVLVKAFALLDKLNIK